MCTGAGGLALVAPMASTSAAGTSGFASLIHALHLGLGLFFPLFRWLFRCFFWGRKYFFFLLFLLLFLLLLLLLLVFLLQLAGKLLHEEAEVMLNHVKRLAAQPFNDGSTQGALQHIVDTCTQVHFKEKL